MAFDSAPYRDVSWGQRIRGEETINAGWQERDLVIQTNGGRLPVLERYGGRDNQRYTRVFEKLPQQ